jgi:hypothetical protein
MAIIGQKGMIARVFVMRPAAPLNLWTPPIRFRALRATSPMISPDRLPAQTERCIPANRERRTFAARGSNPVRILPAIMEDPVTESTSQHDAIVARIGRLERENRRFKRGAIVFLVMIASVGLMAQTRQTPSQKPKGRAPAAPAPAAPAGPTAVEAQGFILKDSSGRIRAELGMAGSTPSLKFRDESGSALVTLSLNSEAPGGPVLLLSDPQHHASVALSVLEKAGPQLSLTGERADIQLRMGVTPDGTALELSDKDGFTTSIGNGIVPKNGQVKKTSAASIVLYNKDRKVLWSQP